MLFRCPGQVNFPNEQVTFQAHSAWKVIHQVIHLKTQLLGHMQTSHKRPPKRSSLGGHLLEDLSITRAYTTLGQHFALCSTSERFFSGESGFPLSSLVLLRNVINVSTYLAIFTLLSVKWSLTYTGSKKRKTISNFSAPKVVAAAFERWSLTRGSKH